MTIHHPEQEPDEIYMGNTTEIPRDCRWRTNRLGVNPIGENGPLIGSTLRPWFIKMHEVRAAIDREKAHTPNPSPMVSNAIAALESMLANRSIFYRATLPTGQPDPQQSLNEPNPKRP